MSGGVIENETDSQRAAGHKDAGLNRTIKPDVGGIDIGPRREANAKKKPKPNPKHFVAATRSQSPGSFLSARV